MRRVINFNDDWYFTKKGFPREKVSVPHTINIEKLDEYRVYRDVVCYEKQFELRLKDKEQAFLEFEGVMTTCKVYVNGRFALKHEGGYTPFVINLTPFAKSGLNEIKLKADNREKKNVPPGKPVSSLDFLYYSGIYRNVNLTIVPEVFITNPNYADKVNGGGIYIETKAVEAGKATVFVKVNLCNNGAECQVKLEGTIKKAGEALARQEQTLKCDKESDAVFNFDINNAKLWSPDEPNLYELTAEVYKDDKRIDCVTERFGVRTAEVKKDGFYLNGQKLYLSGTNRHHQFPFIGIAASDEAQYRDAYKIKQMGANIIRLSHYAHPKAFYDACDELGIILINQVPGWQYCRYGKFRRLAVRDVQDMMRRDRNHASMLIMETGLNETVHHQPGATDKFFQQLVDVCKAEGKILTYGSPHGRKDLYAVKFDMISANWVEESKTRPSTGFPGVKSLIPEYGDFEFGGHYSSSRADRNDGENASHIQAWNFQWSYNMNLANPDSLGCLTWEGIDHVRGYDKENPISKSGMMDIFRRPKPVYYMYRSQKPPKTVEDIVLYPSIFNYTGQDKIMFYSNCDKIEMYDGEKLIASQGCDSGEDTPYLNSDAVCPETVLYWTKNGDYLKSSQKNGALARHTMSCLMDSGNCIHMAYPPFTFENLSKYENLTVKGMINGEHVKQIDISPCQGACGVAIDIDYSGKKLVNNGVDFVFVHVTAMDKNGITDCGYRENVKLSVTNGECVFSDTVRADSGIATFMVKAHAGAEDVTVSAEFNGGKTISVRIETNF
jgi:beta-galactosidase